MLDPFKWQKAESLKDSTESVHRMLDYLNDTLEKIAQTEDKSSEELKKHFENLLRVRVYVALRLASRNEFRLLTPDYSISLKRLQIKF